MNAIEISNIEATLGTWTNGTYTMTVTKEDARNVRITDSNKASLVEHDDKWLARLDNMKDNGMWKV